MGRIWGVLFLGVILGQGAGAAPPAPTPGAVLSNLPSAAGGSLWARVQACRMRVVPAISHADVMLVDSATADVQKGDTVVELWVFMPQPIGGETALLWRVRNGTITPQSGWASRIQLDPKIPELRC